MGNYRITAMGTQYIVPTADLLAFKANCRRLGLHILRSAPVGMGYAVTVA